MKNQILRNTFTLLLVGIITLSTVQAQRGMQKGQNQGKAFCDNIPNMTEEQKTKVEDLRTAHMKEMLPLRNEMGELRAKLQTARTGDNVKMDDVNKIIDQKGALQTTMAKKRAEHKQSIRKVLTDKQRVFFDSQQQHRKHRKHRKGQKGNRNGNSKMQNN